MLKQLQIYRSGEAHLLINIDKSTTFSHIVMGEHLVRSTLMTDNVIDVQEGDYIMLGIEKMTINRPQIPVEKESNSRYTYNFEFEGYVYDLRDCPFMHLGALEFDLYLKPADLLALICENMNTIADGWAVGNVDDVPEQLVSFYENGAGFTCKGALIKIAEQFKLEFWLTGKTIHLTKQAGIETNLVFEYGRGRGLYRLVRGAVNDQDYYNRLIIQGGTKNIPYTYRDGAKRLKLDEPYLELPLVGGKKRRVGSVVLDDIYPHRTGTITTVEADWLSFTDTSLDFDLTLQRIEGEKAVIEFTSGENAGKAFEIRDYDHDTKTIKIEPITEADGYVLPNETFSINVGDKYVLLGIIQPEEYFTTAENELRTEGLRLLNKAANAIPPYTIYVDPKFLRDNGLMVNAGDRVRIVDLALGVDAMIRTSGVKYPLVEPNEVDLVVSDVIPLHVNDKLEIDTNKNERDIVITTKVSTEVARRNSKNFEKLANRIFDPDGNLSKDALSVFAGLLKVGFDSQNFGLLDVKIDTKFGNDPNHLTISAGTLQHYQYEIAGLGYDWLMSSASFAGLDPSKFYYVYAKCNTSILAGTWEISENPVLTNDIAGFYCFNLGQLFELDVVENYRDFDFTKGVTYIVGNQITTGRVQDISKQNFFDLETGQFNLGNLLSGIDWNITTAGKLTIRGGIVATGAEFIDLIVKNLRTNATGKRVEILESEHSFSFFDDDNKKSIVIDGDSGVDDGTYESLLTFVDVNGNPQWIATRFDVPTSLVYYIYPNRIAGFQVGYGINDTDGMSTISSKKIFTTGKYSTFSGGLIKDGITKVFDFGSGNTMTVINGIVTDFTGF